jgi:outer membrane protein TolC
MRVGPSLGPSGRFAGVIVAALLLGGCTSAHYRKSADKEVYNIIQQVDRQVFGETNAFTINTPYSSRDPQTIPPREIISDRTTSNRIILNLDQALDLAVKNSREYQTQKEQLYLAALTLTGEEYEFSPHFIATSTASVEGSQGAQSVIVGYDPVTREPIRVPTAVRTTQGLVNNRLGVSQLLKTGGRLSLSLGNDLVRYFTGKPDAVARNSAINTLSADLTQPLLRGFGINDPTVESLTQAERNVVYAVRSFSYYQQQFAVDTVNAYFSLLTQKDIVRNNYANYTNRVETTKYLEARAVDRERESSVDDARTAELSARASYINSLASYLNSLDTFKTRLGLPLSADLYIDDRDLADLIAAGITPVDLDRNAGFRLCLEHQLEILNAIDKFEDTKRKVRVAADQLRAQLDLFSTVSLSSEGPDDYANFDLNKVRYTAGLRLNLPVDRLRERNLYRTSLVNFESQLRSLSLTLDGYKDRIDRGLRTVEQARLNYLNGVESLKVAERRVDNNSMLLEAGRATIRDLREAQDSLIQAQNTLSALYTGYLSSRLGLLLSIGVLDTKPDRFWLRDPLSGLLTAEQRGAPPLRMPDDKVVPPESFLEPSS